MTNHCLFLVVFLQVVHGKSTKEAIGNILPQVWGAEADGLHGSVMSAIPQGP